jgi:hypothetical protein
VLSSFFRFDLSHTAAKIEIEETMKRNTKKSPEAEPDRHPVPVSIAEQQEGQIRVLRGLLEQTRQETGDLERVKAELSEALIELKEFRDQHREREAEIESLIKRTTMIATERAHLVLSGTELLREVRYMARQCNRITGTVQ